MILGLILSACLCLCGLLMMFGFVMQSFVTMLMSRFLIGCISGTFMSITTLMALESAPKSHRGFFVSFSVIFYGMGDLLGAAISLPLVSLNFAISIYMNYHFNSKLNTIFSCLALLIVGVGLWRLVVCHHSLASSCFCALMRVHDISICALRTCPQQHRLSDTTRYGTTLLN